MLAVQIVEVKLVSSGSLTPQQAASFYYARRKPYNLSPGDALYPGAAEALGADVMTAEHGWATLPALLFKVNLIRQAT